MEVGHGCEAEPRLSRASRALRRNGRCRAEKLTQTKFHHRDLTKQKSGFCGRNGHGKALDLRFSHLAQNDSATSWVELVFERQTPAMRFRDLRASHCRD